MRLKLGALLLPLLCQIGCTSDSSNSLQQSSETASVEPQKEATQHPLAPNISKILQDGWTVKQDRNTIRVAREKPVAVYVNVAMDVRRSALKQRWDERSDSTKYEIVIEFGDRVSQEAYRRMAEENRIYDFKFRAMRDDMNHFSAKGEFYPKSEQDRLEYGEYQKALRETSYNRLPDAKDDRYSYYVKTSRSRNESFWLAREERECRAVLENIFSFIDGYSDFTPDAHDEPDTNPPVFDDLVGEVFLSDREYDFYLREKATNLPELRR